MIQNRRRHRTKAINIHLFLFGIWNEMCAFFVVFFIWSTYFFSSSNESSKSIRKTVQDKDKNNNKILIQTFALVLLNCWLLLRARLVERARVFFSDFFLFILFICLFQFSFLRTDLLMSDVKQSKRIMKCFEMYISLKYFAIRSNCKGFRAYVAICQNGFLFCNNLQMDAKKKNENKNKLSNARKRK